MSSLSGFERKIDNWPLEKFVKEQDRQTYILAVQNIA